MYDGGMMLLNTAVADMTDIWHADDWHQVMTGHSLGAAQCELLFILISGIWKVLN